ncbi:MAG: ubiquinol-cytochrome C chaperone family protein [Sphingomicrobium sp.]
MVDRARQPEWYAQMGVPDTIDGRFSVLATLTALVSVRLERGDEDAQAGAVAIAERFIEAMDAEHRQLGIGDPTLGKVVRKLVSGLGRRIDLWRSTIDGGGDWDSATHASVEGTQAPEVTERLRGVWEQLQSARDDDLLLGKL